MIIPVPQTDLITWIQSWDVWIIVAFLLVVQLFVEMWYGRRATEKQLTQAKLEGYDLAGAQIREREEAVRQIELDRDKRVRIQAAIAGGRHPVYLTDLPRFVRERARSKGLAWSLMPMYRVDRGELEA